MKHLFLNRFIEIKLIHTKRENLMKHFCYSRERNDEKVVQFILDGVVLVLSKKWSILGLQLCGDFSFLLRHLLTDWSSYFKE